MNNLLLFFALPFAVIIISIALYKLLNSVFLVVGSILSIFLITTFIINDINLLVPTIIYTIISFIVVEILSYFMKIKKYITENCCRKHHCENKENKLLTIDSECCNNRNNLLTISSECQNGENKELLKINSNSIEEKNCEQENDIKEINARVNLISNNEFSNNGRRNYCMCRRCRRY